MTAECISPAGREPDLVVLWSLWRLQEGHSFPQTSQQFVKDLSHFLSAQVCLRTAEQAWSHVLGGRPSNPCPATISLAKLQLLAAEHNVQAWTLDDLWEILEHAPRFQADIEDYEDSQAEVARETGPPLTMSGLDALAAEIFSEIERRERGNLRRPLLCGRDLLHLFSTSAENTIDGDE